MYRKLYFIGFAAYVVFFVLAVLFYKERVVFVDLAYHLFFLLKDNAFVPNLRFGAFITQIMPLQAARAAWQLDSIILCYSLSFVCYHFLYYTICGFFLKRYDFALVLLLFNILFTTQTFYWVQSELPQGINLFILVQAVASRIKLDGSNYFYLPLVFLGMFVVAFFHPVILFPVLFSIIFFYLSTTCPVIEKKILVSMLVFFAGVYFLKAKFFKVSYDAQVMDHSISNLTLKNAIFNFSNIHFLKNCIGAYCWLSIGFLGTISYYIRKRMWWKFVLVLTFFTGYLITVNVSHPGAETADFYIENLYLPLGLFVAIPLVFDVMPVIKIRHLVPVLFVSCLATGLFRIYLAHKLYTERLAWERSFLVQNFGKKIILSEKKFPPYLLGNIWGTPYEFWLLSTVEFNKSASIMISDIPDNYSWANTNSNFITTWVPYKYSDLPKQYFRFSDTVSKYEIIK